MELIDERTFPQAMEEEVEPFLAQYRETGKYLNELYYETYFLPRSRATVVISHGFTESSVKFREFMYYLLKAGFSCAVIDHRGHGYSARMVDDPQLVHIDEFERYVREFHGFTEQVVKPKTAGPLYLFGHSMGGCVAARVLEEYPNDFSRAILNAPMLGLVSGNIPPWAGALFCRGKILLGKGDQRLFFHKGFEAEPVFEEDCATSRARFDHYHALRRKEPALQTAAASYRWTKEGISAGNRAIRHAGKIRVPVLLLQAENDTLVSAKAQQKFIAKVPKGKLVCIPQSKHEIYRSVNAVLEGYWRLILDFYNG